MAKATKRRERLVAVKASSKEPSRRGLWVVVAGRMKQYGDMAIERPGQIIRQAYLKNDNLLLKHNYVRPLDRDEEYETCTPCGSMFLGTSISGAYQAHLAFARHDLVKVDLDSGTKSPSGRKQRTGDPTENPDSEAGGDWDLEPEGQPPVTKAKGSGARVSV